MAEELVKNPKRIGGSLRAHTSSTEDDNQSRVRRRHRGQVRSTVGTNNLPRKSRSALLTPRMRSAPMRSTMLQAASGVEHG